MKKKKYNVAVAGATGMVGQEFLKILEQRDFPIDKIKLLASERSAGQYLEFRGKEEKVHLLSKETFEGIDIGLFSPGASVSKVYAPIAAKAGCVVIDNTSQFRMEPDIPLVVPEVNPKAIAQYKKRNIIANPNCSTIQMVVALKPIHDAAKIKELKMVNETKKIMDDSIKVTATTVRVPVFNSHSESVNIETEKKITAKEVRKILSNAPGVKVLDDPENKVYPMPIEASENDEVFVGRIREDDTIPNGINMWIVSDNIRKGAALNAVQIAEVLIKEYL
ncbi:MAG: aspartate-semialdehyde dehydrogenase [Deltaproteobacteria bacterium]|nr:aspartate-semialdehyde dehydrogenase [Deltaproteobacteria bacterium]